MTAQNAAEIETAITWLNQICDHFQPTLNGQGSQQFHQAIADKLNAIAQPKKPWSQRYIVSVRNGKVEPSQAMIWAIRALAYSLDDTPLIVARSKPVQVLAAGQVHQSAVILGDSKPCGFAGCPVQFVPVVPWQRYCCSECRIKNAKLLRGSK